MEVHQRLGNGFQEIIYQRALEIKLDNKLIEFKLEHEMSIWHKNELIGNRRVDFLVEDKISVGLKVIACLEEVHFAQAINYLEVYNLEIGLLINFGSKRLEFKWLINSKCLNR